MRDERRKVHPATQADHAGHLETAVSGYAEALRHLNAYLRMETDEAKKDAVRSKVGAEVQADELG